MKILKRITRTLFRNDENDISMDEAKDKAEQEYNIFNKHQKINSDFDKFSKKILEQSKNN